jgi:uncharacterized protein with FMN-binding domain
MSSIDPLLQERLASLGSRRTGGGAGGTLPPPVPPGARRSPRRVKPARSSKLAALGLSVAATAGLTSWFAHAAAIDSAPPDPTTAPATAASSTTASPTTTIAVPGTTAPAAVTPVAATVVADGAYAGAAANTRYGAVQVQVVYRGGAITDVAVLRYPDSNRRDQAINQQALPWLTREAIAAQSAEIDTVSGATYTSNGYRTSLQSAIDAAKQASGVTG